MKYRYIPAFTMLLAGLICCIMSIVQKWDVTYSLCILVLVLFLFYIIGQIAAQIVGKVIAEHEAMVQAEKERKRLEEEERARLEEEAKKAEKEMKKAEKEMKNEENLEDDDSGNSFFR